MTSQPDASLTPVGDWFDRKFGARVSTHAVPTAEDPVACAPWHPVCAYEAGRAEALRQLAADLEFEAAAVSGLAEPPWAAMYGLKVTSGTEAAVILRRAAELALRRAEGRAETPGLAAASIAPQRAVQAGDNSNYGTEGERP